MGYGTPHSQLRPCKEACFLFFFAHQSQPLFLDNCRDTSRLNLMLVARHTGKYNWSQSNTHLHTNKQASQKGRTCREQKISQETSSLWGWYAISYRAATRQKHSTIYFKGVKNQRENNRTCIKSCLSLLHLMIHVCRLVAGARRYVPWDLWKRYCFSVSGSSDCTLWETVRKSKTFKAFW